MSSLFVFNFFAHFFFILFTFSFSSYKNTTHTPNREPLDDALEVVGTSASIAVLRERILRGDATPARTQSWIESLSFIPKPDLSLLTEAVSILRARDKYPQILLSFSNLANSYCSAVGGPACIQDQPVIILSKLYEKYFEATGCSTKRRKEVDQVQFC